MEKTVRKVQQSLNNQNEFIEVRHGMLFAKSKGIALAPRYKMMFHAWNESEENESKIFYRSDDLLNNLDPHEALDRKIVHTVIDLYLEDLKQSGFEYCHFVPGRLHNEVSNCNFTMLLSIGILVLK